MALLLIFEQCHFYIPTCDYLKMCKKKIKKTQFSTWFSNKEPVYLKSAAIHSEKTNITGEQGSWGQRKKINRGKGFELRGRSEGSELGAAYN